MNEKTKIALKEIIDYLWDDEEKNFEECELELGTAAAEEHIFSSLQIVNQWFKENHEQSI